MRLTEISATCIKAPCFHIYLCSVFPSAVVAIVTEMNIETKESEAEAAASHISSASDKTQFYKPNYTF